MLICVISPPGGWAHNDDKTPKTSPASQTSLTSPEDENNSNDVQAHQRVHLNYTSTGSTSNIIRSSSPVSSSAPSAVLSVRTPFRWSIIPFANPVLSSESTYDRIWIQTSCEINYPGLSYLPWRHSTSFLGYPIGWHVRERGPRRWNKQCAPSSTAKREEKRGEKEKLFIHPSINTNIIFLSPQLNEWWYWWYTL